jgi:hypothetical protein
MNTPRGDQLNAHKSGNVQILSRGLSQRPGYYIPSFLRAGVLDCLQGYGLLEVFLLIRGMDGHRRTVSSMSNYTPESRPGVRRRSVFAPFDPDYEPGSGWPDSRDPGFSRTMSQALRPVSDVLTRRGNNGRSLRPLRVPKHSVKE